MTRRQRGLVQAPVQPVDEDGVVASVTGTAVFAVASVVLAVFREELAAQGNGWWFLVSIAGVVIGVCAMGYTSWRRRQRPSEPSPPDPETASEVVQPQQAAEG